MQKTILIIINRLTQLTIGYDLSEIPNYLKQNVTFVLIINENLKSVLDQNIIALYEKIYFVKVNSLDEVNICFIESDLLETLDTICNLYQNIYAFTTDEINLSLIENVLAQYKIPGWNKNTALLCRDKILMKQHMQKFNIRTPKFLSYKESLSFNELVNHLGLPFILKPTNKAGSLGFYKINNDNDYKNFLADFDRTIPYEAEEFINGILYHIDTVKYDKLLFSTVGEYLSPMAESQNGKLQGSIEIRASDKYYNQLLAFNNNVIDSFNNNGCFHHEVFINQNGEIIFLEIAWRRPGTIVGLIFTQHFGISQAIFYIMLHLGADAKTISKYSKKHTEGYAIKFLVPQVSDVYHGIVIPKLNGKVEITNLIEPGTIMGGKAKHCSSGCAELRITYPSFDTHYNLMRQDFETLRSYDSFMLNISNDSAE